MIPRYLSLRSPRDGQNPGHAYVILSTKRGSWYLLTFRPRGGRFFSVAVSRLNHPTANQVRIGGWHFRWQRGRQ